MTNHNPPGEIPLEQNPAFEPELVETGFLDLFLVKPAIVYRHGNAPEACAKVGCIGHDGSYPIIGVNTFLNPAEEEASGTMLSRSTEEEKQSQLRRLGEFEDRNREEADKALEHIRNAVINNGNVFAELMDAVRYCSLGQLTDAFFATGGQYRRSM